MFDNLVPASFIPVAVIFFIIMFFIYYIMVIRPKPGTTQWITMRKEAQSRRLTVLNKRYPLESSDIIPLTVIAFVFLVLAVFNLGSQTPVDVLSEISVREETGSLSPGSTHLNNMYFDEVYFVRTAVEHIEGVNAYEWTHPPLGKNIIAASILLFGESPFGWRLIGSICGVIMVLVMYIFVKNMFGKTTVATCGALLLGFEFMRIVHSRMGTVDTFAILFILLSYYFMYRLVTTDPDAGLGKSLPSLALSGFFFGLSFSVKWIGFYAGAGLLIIYIIRLVQLWNYYMTNEKKGFVRYFFGTVLYSFLFFIIIPAAIYYINYIPYGISRGMSLRDGMLWSPDFFNVVWKNQGDMLGYHGNLEATHGGSSRWWQWLFDIKPILYVNNHIDGARATYGGFGNPVLYWGGFAAMIVMIFRIFKYRDGKALILVIGYLAQLLPWVAVTRITFAYHYLPCTLFLILALSHIFNTILDTDDKDRRFYVYGYMTVTGVTFAVFYPMLAGVHLPHWYYDTFIKWLPSWPF